MPDIPFYDLKPAGNERRRSLHDVLDEVLDGGYFVGGAPVADFEQRFANYLGVRECVGVGNGLDAMRIGMEGLGIGPDDEVIVPGFTFFATWLAITQVGATPVPVDVDLNTASLDVAATIAAITAKTRAIIVVHLYGIPADLAALRQVADEAGISLIEDAAQSHGAKSAELLTGSVGDFAAFSFYPTKNLGALGDGGAIVTNSMELATSARSRRSYGQGLSKYEHVDTGWNSRLDSIQAAFLSEDLPNLDARNQRRRSIASAYLDALGSGAEGVIGGDHFLESVWHQFVVRVSDRDRVRQHFNQHGVSTDIHYPYHFNDVEPLKRYWSSSVLPNSKMLSRQVLSFPISPWLAESEVAQVVKGFATLPHDLIATR